MKYFQDSYSKSASKLNEILNLSGTSSNERMAATALTELSNVSDNTNADTIHEPTSFKTNFKESILNVTPSNTNQCYQMQVRNSKVATLQLSKEASLGTTMHSESIDNVTNNQINFANDITNLKCINDFSVAPSAAPSAIDNFKQLQQQLETAAVLMDISKKVIISPPTSNPQSPSLSLVNDTSINNSVIKKNQSSKSNFHHGKEIDLSVKKQIDDNLSSSSIVFCHTKSPIKTSNFTPANLSEQSIIQTDDNYVKNMKSCERNLSINENMPNKIEATANCSDTDTDESSDSNRLQMDITLAQDADATRVNVFSKNRETPDSDHGTDAATTQLWQALAHNACNYDKFC